MVDGEVANIGKTYANMYRIFMYMYISHILIYFPYVIPGAISLAKSGCLKYTYIHNIHIYYKTLNIKYIYIHILLNSMRSDMEPIGLMGTDQRPIWGISGQQGPIRVDRGR